MECEKYLADLEDRAYPGRKPAAVPEPEKLLA
jgi:hypothetical protein